MDTCQNGHRCITDLRHILDMIAELVVSEAWFSNGNVVLSFENSSRMLLLEGEDGQDDQAWLEELNAGDAKLLDSTGGWGEQDVRWGPVSTVKGHRIRDVRQMDQTFASVRDDGRNCSSLVIITMADADGATSRFGLKLRDIRDREVVRARLQL